MGGPVAQKGSERRPAEPEVAGSSPAGPAILVFLIVLGLLSPIAVTAQGASFDAVIVRGDIYTDWAVAMAYGITHGSWVVHLTTYNEREVLNLLSGLMRFRKGINILIIGAPNAVPMEFEDKIRSIGADVKRIGGPTRLDTSLLLAMYYWNDCKSLILSDGFNSSYYMVALSVAVEHKAPIIYTKEGNPPEGFEVALRDHLKNVKEIYVIGDSLNGEYRSHLLSEGYKIVNLIEVNRTSTYREGWSPAFILREILNPLPLLFGLVVGFLLMLIIHLRVIKREGTTMDLIDFFTVDERKVIEIVMEKGEVSQEELPELTGFSKPKISRLLKDLVDRKVVERKKFGKTYLVKLTDKFKSHLE